MVQQLSVLAVFMSGGSQACNSSFRTSDALLASMGLHPGRHIHRDIHYNHLKKGRETETKREGEGIPLSMSYHPPVSNRVALLPEEPSQASHRHPTSEAALFFPPTLLP